jgi:hypothetical protein
LNTSVTREREDDMTQLTGAFKVMGWDERLYDSVPGHPKLTHADVTYELSGGIDGEASVNFLMAYRPDDAASYVGLIRVTGRIGDRAGSFVARDVGSFDNGIAKSRWTILPGLGTDDLRDIRGEGHFTASTGVSSYLLDVDLGPRADRA